MCPVRGPLCAAAAGRGLSPPWRTAGSAPVLSFAAHNSKLLSQSMSLYLLHIQVIDTLCLCLLTYFTWHKAFKVFLCSHKWQELWPLSEGMYWTVGARVDIERVSLIVQAFRGLEK